MRKRSPFRVLLVVIWTMAGVFLPACQMETTMVPATPTPIPTCVSSNPNPYDSHNAVGPDKIYRDLRAGTITLEQARKEAYLRLAVNAEHWSEFRDLARDDNRMIRVTITLIDPILVQYIVLNHALRNEVITGLTMTPEDFDATIKAVMARFGERKELLFLVTVTSPEYVNQPYGERALTAQIPFEEMVMINASDMRVASSHDDHNLSEPITINGGPQHGYIGFPLAVLHQGNCIFIMDLWNTTATLEVGSAQLGDKEFQRLSWTIPYYPLVEQTSEHPVTGFYAVEQYMSLDVNLIQPQANPPQPAWNPNSELPEGASWRPYWQNVGSYLWYLVMDPAHH